MLLQYGCKPSICILQPSHGITGILQVLLYWGAVENDLSNFLRKLPFLPLRWYIEFRHFDLSAPSSSEEWTGKSEFEVILCPKYFTSIKQPPTVCSQCLYFTFFMENSSCGQFEFISIILEEKYRNVHRHFWYAHYVSKTFYMPKTWLNTQPCCLSDHLSDLQKVCVWY